MGRKTLIDWADASWNPVTGCKHGCEYCYARGIARRFGCKINGDMGTALAVLEKPYVSMDGVTNPYPYEFLPTYHKYRLDIPQTWKRPKNIFVCSMADLFGDWVPDDWIDQVLTACLAAPQHRYLFLTKNPKRYDQLARDGILLDNDNFWYGTSTPTPTTRFWFSDKHNTFTSIEPILKPFGYCKWHDYEIPNKPKWAIIGAETGNRKGKVIPQKEWISYFAESCRENGIPVFMKESLRGIMGEDFRQEFPWEAKC